MNQQKCSSVAVFFFFSFFPAGCSQRFVSTNPTLHIS